ncbi:UNVERIFIED_CONTAM: hypothetical protein H355_005478, partial [Colinus virginianus]
LREDEIVEEDVDWDPQVPFTSHSDKEILQSFWNNCIPDLHEDELVEEDVDWDPQVPFTSHSDKVSSRYNFSPHPCPAMISVCHAILVDSSLTKATMMQCLKCTVITVPPPVIVVLSASIHSSFLQNITVRSSTSAVVGSILSSDGVLTICQSDI